MTAFILSLFILKFPNKLFGRQSHFPIYARLCRAKVGGEAPKEQTGCMTGVGHILLYPSKILQGTLAVLHSHKQRPNHLQ